MGGGRANGNVGRWAALRRSLVAAILVALVVACEQPRPSGPPDASQVAGQPTPTAGTSEPPASSAPAPSGGPLEDEPTPPSSSDLILAALAAGELDEPTAILYRLFAVVNDERLPEQYRGEWSEDDAAQVLAVQGYDAFPQAIQEQLVPFLVRPTSPLSYWAPVPEAVARAAPAAAGVALAAYQAPQTAAAACVNGFISQRAAAPAQAIVWGQCGARSEADVQAQVGKVAGFISALWKDMTTLMGGGPIGDQNDPSTNLDDATESNDGLLDLYIVDATVSRHGRSLDSTGLAACHMAFPYEGAPQANRSSAYLVFEASKMTDDVRAKSLVAHEFFHALSKRHNNSGMLVNGQWFWLSEASAQWSEHQFVPEARRKRDYPFYEEFAITTDSLSAPIPDRNGYKSWMWPMFMAQEKGKEAVARAWVAARDQYGFQALMTAVDRQLAFKTNFREFAVRLWNEQLLDGDPIDPDFQGWDGGFPRHHPSRGRYKALYDVPADAPSTAPHEFPTTLPSLWNGYYWLTIQPDVKQLIVDFSGLTPATALDVDALVEIKDKGWERRELPNGRTRFCLENDDDAIKQAIVVLSNHDIQPSTQVTGKWTVQGLAQACADLSGTITIQRDGIYNSVDGPQTTQSEHLTATIAVDMISDPDPFGGGGYIDDRSKFSIQRTTLASKVMGDCTSTFATKSDGTWAFTDHPVGTEWENGITGFVEPTLGVVVLAIVVHYPYVVTEDACNLVPNVNVGVHDAFACEGDSGMFGGFLEGKITEVEDGPDEVTFSCTMVDENEGGWTRLTTTVTGTLTLADRPGP